MVSQRFAARGPLSDFVDFRSEDEIAFGQAIDFVGPRGDFRFSPGQQNIRMMALLFGDRADFIDESEGLREIRKLEGAGEVMTVHHAPLRHLIRQRL